MNVLLFEYVGFGITKNVGNRKDVVKPSEHGLYDSAMAAFRHLVEVHGIPPNQIFIFGNSLGTT